MKLYVGNLPYEMTNAQFIDMFTPFGTVISAKMIIDRDSGKSKGFGFVEMSNRSEGHKVMEGLNGTRISNFILVVNEAIPRKKRGGRRM